MNGCEAYRRLYAARHDRIVNLIATAVRDALPRDVPVHKQSCVMSDLSKQLIPDVVFVDDGQKEVTVLGIG